MSKKYLSDNFEVNNLISGNGRIQIKGNILTNPNGAASPDNKLIVTNATIQILNI